MATDSNFEQCLKIILGLEGGLSNHPNDRGGLTNYGVIQRVYDEFRQKLGFPKRSVAQITMPEVREIYLKNYWGPCKAEEFRWPLDLVSFDGAVNCGPRQQALFLQRALGVLADGIIGPKTLAAAKTADPVEVSRRILIQRRGFYRRLVEEDASQGVFLEGWLNRVAKIQARVSDV